MASYDVYDRLNIEPIRGKGCKLWDSNGIEYLDFYGGHAVISIGHAHPKFTKMVTEQLNTLSFYSNATLNSLQDKASEAFESISGYTGYNLFLCNSGAEANENALKLASFKSGRERILAFSRAFHGRTSGALEITDNPKIRSPFNNSHNVTFATFNDIQIVERELSTMKYAAVIIEGIQGVGGIHYPTQEFWCALRELCTKYGTYLIVDEVQSGCGRTGKYFAHQWFNIKADLITMAKGIGNGFPIGGVLISPDIKVVRGEIGSTFGGNHLACVAALAVIDTIKEDGLLENVLNNGQYLKKCLEDLQTMFSKAIKEIRGIGLMLGIELYEEYIETRNLLLNQKHIFTGTSGKSVIRVLPPLCITREDIDTFIDSLKYCIKLQALKA